MGKKLIHHVKHSLKHHVPAFGGGFGIGVFWIVDSIEESISEITNDSETIQSCIEIFQSVLPF